MTQIDQKPIVINLERSRGDTFPIPFRLTNKKTKVGIDVTGDTYKLSVSAEEFPTGNTYVLQSIGEITDVFEGKIQFPIDATAADNLGDFFYDVERTYDGVTKTLIKGTIAFIQDITK